MEKMINLVVEEGNSFLDGEQKLLWHESYCEHFVGMKGSITFDVFVSSGGQVCDVVKRPLVLCNALFFALALDC